MFLNGIKCALVWKPAVAAALSLVLAGCVPATLASVSPSGSLFGASNPPPEPLQLSLFVASTRPAPGNAAQGDGSAHYALNMISVPPGHRPGAIELPVFGKPNPKNHFAVAYERGLGAEEFSAQISSHLSGRIGANRDVLIFVHGFNTSLDEARLRLAQIVADGRFGGVPILFTWASSSSFLAYETDKQAATISRDALAKLLTDLGQAPGVGRVHVLAHSMGGWLAMETLREAALSGNGTLNGRLGEVMLAAPDIDLGVFRQQMARVKGTRVSVFTTPGDRALNLSSRLAGARPRVGAIDASKSGDRAELQNLGVKIYDLSQFSSGFVQHGAYANAPEVIRTIGAELKRTRDGEGQRMSVIDAGVDRAPDAPLTPGNVETLPLPDASQPGL